MKYYVYILYSPRYKKYYIGQTKDLDSWLIAHNTISENSFTSKYRPWVLLISLDVPSRGIAMKIEKYLKKKNRVFINRVTKDQDLREYIVAKFS